MTAELVHGFPETSAIWRPLQQALGHESVALALPGFGASRPRKFAGTKDAYADWLAGALGDLAPPVEVVGHDVGALLTLRLVTAYEIPVRSWTVDVANIFHPGFSWPERVHSLQKYRTGEEILRYEREADPSDPCSTSARLIGAGVPPELAAEIAPADDEAMSRSILDFY